VYKERAQKFAGGGLGPTRWRKSKGSCQQGIRLEIANQVDWFEGLD